MLMDLDSPKTNRKSSAVLILAGSAAVVCLLLLALFGVGISHPQQTDASIAPPQQPVVSQVLHCNGFDFEVPAADWQKYDTATSQQATGSVLGFKHRSPYVDFSVAMPHDLPADFTNQAFAEGVKQTLQYHMAEFQLVDQSPFAIHGTPGIRLRFIGTASSPDEPEMYGVLWFSQWNGQPCGLRVAGSANNAGIVNAAADEMFEHFHPRPSPTTSPSVDGALAVSNPPSPQPPSSAPIPTAPESSAVGIVLPVKNTFHFPGFNFQAPSPAWRRYDSSEVLSTVGAVLCFERGSPYIDFSVVMPHGLPADLSTQSFANLSRQTLRQQIPDLNVIEESPLTLHGTPGIRLRIVGTLSSNGLEMYGVFWFSQWLGHHYCLKIGGPAINATQVDTAAREMFEHFHPCADPSATNSAARAN